MPTTTKIVKDLMVTLDAYSHVSEDASLLDAIESLERAPAGSGSEPARPRDRAVLVQSEDGQVIGKLSQWDMLRGLEPRYEDQIEVIANDYFLWTHAMFVNLAAKAKSVKAKDLLREHFGDETIDENATLDQAVHQLVQSRLLSLIVTGEGNVVGVLRLSDVFVHVCESMNAASAAAAAG